MILAPLAILVAEMNESKQLIQSLDFFWATDYDYSFYMSTLNSVDKETLLPCKGEIYFGFPACLLHKKLNDENDFER